jgi:aconitate hydratase
MTMSPISDDSFNVKDSLDVGSETFSYFDITELDRQGITDLESLPFSIRVLLENLVRTEDGRATTAEDIEVLADYDAKDVSDHEVAFMPSRVVMQDLTGVPAIVDFAALRSAMERFGGDPSRINPEIPAQLVIDHSVQVDEFGTQDAIRINEKMEYERNEERYAFLRWGQEQLNGLDVVPPDTGIIHQVNIEYFASVIEDREYDGERVAHPDTLLGTDSHTTMVNSLGVMGWGVGGIEAEATMLGEPYYMLLPEVVGFELTGELQEGATATDLVLTVTQMLREHGCVNKFVEFHGDGLHRLTLPDRATIANMSPEYGATMGFFPVDRETLNYLELTGRSERRIDLVEKYCKEQNLFHEEGSATPEYSSTLSLDMSTVEPSVAGPTLPHDRISLYGMKQEFWRSIREDFDRDLELPEDTDEDVERWVNEGGQSQEDVDLRPEHTDIYPDDHVEVEVKGEETSITHGSTVVAAITSCTNTSNPTVMVGAGLLAKNAVEKGLDVPPYVKTSLAPGSRVVTQYLKELDLIDYLNDLKFNLVGYGCTTCIGNTGPLPEEIEEAAEEHDLVLSSVLSGNRNFEGRISPYTLSNYLASPPLVVAFALAGTVDIDFGTEPIGEDDNGDPVYLQDIWPSMDEIKDAITGTIDSDMFREQYEGLFEGTDLWNNLDVPEQEVFEWDEESTYIQEPPFFENMPVEVPERENIEGARCLVAVGDSVTTDHISPAGAIPSQSPAGQYLIEKGVKPDEFNSYGSRRGNDRVMTRGTFGNIRLDNKLSSQEGGYTTYLPEDEETSIYDASMRYQENDTPLIVMAGKQYGTGSSRDWAAKGTDLLGVDLVIAESYERIHIANLIGMGVLPARFKEDEGWRQLGLDGTEVYSVEGIESMEPRSELTITAEHDDGSETVFAVDSCLETEIQIEYWQNGGILQYVLRNMLQDVDVESGETQPQTV